jgi:CubicO group peptidase (beta-lactamase class C family)
MSSAKEGVPKPLATNKELQPMSIKKLLLPSLAVWAVLALAFELLAKTVLAKPVADRASPEASYEAIDAYIEQQMRRLNVPGASLGIVEGDRIVHLRGFGQARPDGGAPTPQTPFFIGSLTKSVTALAVMQLVEAGKIELDAPVQRYLPWFTLADPQASARITVRHLLNQTSGLTTSSGRIRLADFDTSPDATERQARALASLTLARPAGSAFEYSNSNYNVLGLVVEAASGEAYADYVRKHIFTPLDMSHSYTSPAGAKQNGLALGHRYWFAVPFAAPGLPIPSGSLPSGQLMSSAEDMAHYLMAHLNEGRYGDAQMLSPVGMEELHRGVAEDIEMGLSMGKYGMGWFVTDAGPTQTVWHTGIVPDSFAYMALLPEQKKGVVLLFNAYGYLMTPALTEAGAGVAALLAGDRPAPIQFGFMPWVQRGLLLIPLLQVIGVATTLRRLRRWRQDPDGRPRGARKWGLHILLALIPNLLLASSLSLMLGQVRGFWMLFMPDVSWIAMMCGSFALVWSFLRTGLVLRTLRKPLPPPTLVGRLRRNFL